MARSLFPIILAACLLLPRLGDRPYWGDEMEDFNFIHRILERGLPDMTGAFGGGALQTNSRGWHVYHSWAPLYENALAVRYGGWDNEFLFRLPMVLFALASVWGMGLLARELGQRGGWAQAFFVLSPFFLVPSRLGRYYGASLCCTVFLLHAYLRLRRGLAGWPAGLWLVIFFHHNMMHAAALAIGLVLHWLCTGRPHVASAAKATALVAVLLLPWVWWLELGGGSGGFSVGTLVRQAPKTLWLVLAGFWSAPLIAWVILRRRELGVLPGLALSVLIPLSVFISASNHVAPSTRYLLPLLPLGALAMGRFFESPLKSGSLRVGLALLLVFTNVAHLIPLGLIHLCPLEKMEAYGRKGSDAVRFFSATATPRFLVLAHLGELVRGCQDPSVDLREALLKAGYKQGELVSLVTVSSRDEARQVPLANKEKSLTVTTSASGASSDTRYFLTQAMFYIYGGLPGEMIPQDFQFDPEAPWQVVGPGAEPEPGGRLVAVTDNPPGFWPDGPDPFNRRYTTEKGEGFRIYRKP
ncbi:MAG: hypothetical protein AB7F75_03165 [Planctomycetota bacterium]